MGDHPPWLRFQAYLVGLPKTGSTSVAAMFGNYRSAHEWQMAVLIRHGIARLRGDLDDAGFLQAVGPRLTSPRLEMDSATCHHLYADVLRDEYPNALFVHTIRDVHSWVNSALDMLLRKRIARRRLGIDDSDWERAYVEHLTAGTYDLAGDDGDGDVAAVPALMRYWSTHLHTMAEVVPPERTLRLRTADLSRSIGDVAAFVGVKPATLRADLSHVNRASLSFDRFAAVDAAEIRTVYADCCAEVMAESFPVEHRAWLDRQRRRTAATDTPDWQAYVRATEAWVAEAIDEYGEAAAR